jgi:uncharacterized membrane protein AbrB (regulator of aidB expression)
MGIMLALGTMVVALVLFVSRLSDGKSPGAGMGELMYGFGWLVACIIVAAVLWRNIDPSGAPEPWVLGSLAVGFVLTCAFGGRNDGK